MILIVDASVACKWYLTEEEWRPQARALLAENITRLAPDLVFAEVGNVLYKHAQRIELPAHAMQWVGAHLSEAFQRVIPCGELFSLALSLASTLRHPIYDCFYLALAQRERIPLITADRRLLDKLKNQDWGGRALSLQEWSAMDGPPKLPIK